MLEPLVEDVVLQCSRALPNHQVPLCPGLVLIVCFNCSDQKLQRKEVTKIEKTKNLNWPK